MISLLALLAADLLAMASMGFALGGNFRTAYIFSLLGFLSALVWGILKWGEAR